jgi:hypothetical protein
LWQVGGFLLVLWFPPTIKLTAIWLKYCWKWRYNTKILIQFYIITKKPVSLIWFITDWKVFHVEKKCMVKDHLMVIHVQIYFLLVSHMVSVVVFNATSNNISVICVSCYFVFVIIYTSLLQIKDVSLYFLFIWTIVIDNTNNDSMLHSWQRQVVHLNM